MKTFAVRRAFFQYKDNDTVGGDDVNRHRQGTFFIAAKKKVDAIETLKSFGYTVRPAECTLGMGNAMEALLEAGVIKEGELVLTPGNGRALVGKVRFNEAGERVAEHIGELTVGSHVDSFRQSFTPKV